MKVIPNGTKVTIIEARIKATVLGVCMTGEKTPLIEYRLIYWVGGERKDSWLYAWEVEVFIDTSKKAGLVNYETGIEKT